jgi:hypothetical protein
LRFGYPGNHGASQVNAQAGCRRFNARVANALAARFGGERLDIPHCDTNVVLLQGHGRVKTNRTSGNYLRLYRIHRMARTSVKPCDLGKLKRCANYNDRLC